MTRNTLSRRALLADLGGAAAPALLTPSRGADPAVVTDWNATAVFPTLTERQAIRSPVRPAGLR